MILLQGEIDDTEDDSSRACRILFSVVSAPMSTNPSKQSLTQRDAARLPPVLSPVTIICSVYILKYKVRLQNCMI